MTVAGLVDVLGAWWATFPAEAVPDGAIFGPHHVFSGALAVLFACWVVSDDLRRVEPVLTAAGALLALFGFAVTWRYYPETGALLTLLGAVVATVAPLVPGGTWSLYPLGWRALAVLGGLVVLDDAVSHAFGVWTPLDAGWMQYLAPVVS